MVGWSGGYGYVQLNKVRQVVGWVWVCTVEYGQAGGSVVGWSGGYGYVQLNMVRQVVGYGYVQLNMVRQMGMYS